MDVCVRLLGKFELTCDGAVAIDGAWKPAKGAAIVKILALRPGRSMHRDQLIAALWPEADAEAGTNSLYKSLHQLRQTIRRAGGPRDVIHLNHPTISLAPYVRIDIDDAERRAAAINGSSSPEELTGVLALIAEPLLPDDPYEPWTEPFRSELALRGTRLRLQLARLHADARSFDEAIAQYKAVLDADDLCEEARLGLIRAYMGAERRDLAMREYERGKELLSSELGTRPSDEMEALAAELRRGYTRSKIEEAVDEPVRAGDEAMRSRAYGEAIAHYREAIGRLKAEGEDDEREANIWLKLARATSAIGTQAEVAECCRRAALLAERARAYRLLARALTQFQDATDSGPGEHAGHRESSELIEAALGRLPAGEDAARAMLLSAGARPLAAAMRSENERHVTGRLSVAGGPNPAIEERLREAVALARRVGERELLTMTLTRLRTYITSPDTLDERLELTREIVELTSAGRDAIAQYTGQLFRHEDLLEAGDIDGARIQARNMRRLGESIESSGILAIALSLQATHETADGQIAEASRTLRQSRLEDEKQGTTSNSQNRFGSQLLMLRWHAGRIAEMEPGFRRAVDVFPRMTPTRAALAFIYSETGAMEKARAELALLPQVEAISRDFSWWFTNVFMAYTAIATGDTERVRGLYASMLPFAERNASNAGSASFGSASLMLALLAEHLGEREDAERHYEHALAFNIRTRQRTWIARTRYHYASMLMARDAAGDADRARELLRIARGDAYECGMSALVAQIEALPEQDVSC